MRKLDRSGGMTSGRIRQIGVVSTKSWKSKGKVLGFSSPAFDFVGQIP
jgi:hypothetical protein